MQRIEALELENKRLIDLLNQKNGYTKTKRFFRVKKQTTK